MATRDEISEAVRRSQQELDIAAPRIAEVLGLTSTATPDLPRGTCMWTPTQMATATKIKALRTAGFSNLDMIQAFKRGELDALYALLEEPDAEHGAD